MRLSLGGIFALVLVGCATPGTQLPSSVRGTQEVLSLGSAGKIFIEQRFRPSPDRCRLARVDLASTVRGSQGRVAVESHCNEQAGLFQTTTDFVPKGEYTIELPRNRRLYSSGPAVISVEYRNADFNSGEDGSFETAAELAPGQKMDGEVQYHAGDRTDWVRMTGKQASVGLVFSLPEGGRAEAEAFASLPGNSGVRRLGALEPGKAKRFPLGSDDLLIRVRADERAPGTAYSLARRDTEAAKSSRVKVVDCYPIGSGKGLAILRVTEGVAVNDSVVISASDASGKRSTLGKCVVQSVDGTNASCQLPYSEHAEWVDFRAEGVYSAKGGSA
ncbi:hypothetical protein K2X33_12350 [bacterium]|nr:hypothetical protein [bacterium]